MNIAVRYYSRSGNTKVIAEAIAEAAGVNAVSVDAAEAPIDGKADILFIGGALYAYGLDGHLKEYLSSVTKESVGKAVVFSTSWLSKHALDLIGAALKEKGIPVEKDTFYVKSKEVQSQVSAAKSFAKRFMAE